MTADIIDLTSRRQEKENLLTERPLEFRKGDWPSGPALLCTRKESSGYEKHRIEASAHPGHSHIRLVPEHINLDEGYHYTVAGLFRHRDDEPRMRRVYRLAGLMECVTNAPSPVLRTDLLRRFYQSILDERKILEVYWRGDARHFLLPIHPQLYRIDRFIQQLSAAVSLKELFEVIDSETGKQFDVLCRNYVIYLPAHFAVRGE